VQIYLEASDSQQVLGPNLETYLLDRTASGMMLAIIDPTSHSFDVIEIPSKSIERILYLR
jgi:hypothetical protein